VDPRSFRPQTSTINAWVDRPKTLVSQTLAVLSRDAVTTRDPSGLNTALETASSCPRRTAISLPVAASQIRAVLSEEAAMMRDPLGLNAAVEKLL
jgi:hypothetical protein